MHACACMALKNRLKEKREGLERGGGGKDKWLVNYVSLRLFKSVVKKNLLEND